MDCDAARRQIDDGGMDPSAAAHLQSCARCRSEAEFRGQVAAAVAAMPRVTAPVGLLDQVMGAIRSSPAARRARRRRALILQAWEIGWISAACLLAAVLLAWFAPWHSWADALVARAQPVGFGAWSMECARAAAPVCQQMLSGLPVAQDVTSTASGWLPWSWVGSAVGFAGGLFLLLTWHGRMNDQGEDAHAC